MSKLGRGTSWFLQYGFVMDVSLGQTFPAFRNLVTPVVERLGSFPQHWHLLHSQDFSETFEKDQYQYNNAFRGCNCGLLHGSKKALCKSLVPAF